MGRTKEKFSIDLSRLAKLFIFYASYLGHASKRVYATRDDDVLVSENELVMR